VCGEGLTSISLCASATAIITIYGDDHDLCFYISVTFQVPTPVDAESRHTIFMTQLPNLHVLGLQLLQL
jgi:hypothetical protein